MGPGRDGHHLNIEPDSPEERARWAFGPSHYRRLQAVKAAWDVDDMFRHCIHIPLGR
jgi:Berberine and berberine like